MDITAPPQSVSTVNREMDALLELELTFQSHLSVLFSGSYILFIKKQLKVPEAELTSIHTLSQCQDRREGHSEGLERLRAGPEA